MAKNETVIVTPVSLLPTPVGCGMFLSDGEKVVLIYIDPSIGASMNDALAQNDTSRPQSHDFFHSIVNAFGGKMVSACIIDQRDDVYYAMATFEMSNEVSKRKIVQVDCRPSDCISMAIRSDIPVHFMKSVWDRQTDSSGLLEDLKEQIDGLDE